MVESDSRKAAMGVILEIPEDNDDCQRAELQRKIYKYYKRYSKYKEKAYSWPMSAFEEEGHSDLISCCSYSPDGNYLATGSEDSKVKIWNIKKQREEFTLNGHLNWVYCCSYSPDGNYLATGSGDSKVKIWNIKKQREEFTMNGHLDWVYCCSYSPDGNYLATGSKNMFIIWNIKEQREEFTVKGYFNWVSCCSYSPDGNYLVIGSKKIIIIWNIKEQRKEFTLNGYSYCCSYSPDGNYLATGSGDSKVKIWNIKKQREEFTLNGHSAWVYCCSYSPDGNYLATGSGDRKVKIWNIKEKREEVTLNEHSGFVFCCSYSPDGNYLATGSKGTVKIWNIKELREELTMNGNLDRVYSCSYSPGENYLATGSKDMVIIWNIKQLKKQFTLRGQYGRVYCCSYSPDENYLAFGLKDTVKIWNIKEQREVLNLENYSKTSIDQNLTSWINSIKSNILSTNNVIPICSKDGLFTIETNDKNNFISCSITNGKEDFSLRYDNSELKGIFFMNNEKYLLAVYEYSIFKISFWNKLLYIINENLSRCIIKRKDLKLLLNDAKVAVFIYDYYNQYYKSKIKIEEQLPIIVSEYLQQFNTNKRTEKALYLSKYLTKFAKLNYNLRYLDYDASIILTEYFYKTINNKANIEGEYYNQILMFLYNSISEFDAKQKIKNLWAQLIKTREYINISTQNNYNWKLLEMKKFINIEELSGNYLYETINHKHFRIELFCSIYSTRKVLVKKYIFNENISKKLAKKIEFEFEKEAKCYELLDKYRNNETSFCEYFGSIKSENSFSIVINNYGMNLIDLINELKNLKSSGEYTLPATQLAIIVKSLIESFAFLANHNILHRFISSKSFLVDENFNFAITEFIFAVTKVDDDWYESTTNLLKDYKSPEEDIEIKDLEKCDVFSLGLVILQLAHLENISKIKQNLDLFIQKLEKMNLKWLQNLLQKMLCEPEERFHFNQLRKLFENDITETISSSVIPR